MSYENSDPKTVAAIEKIKAVLRDHDLWATSTIVSEERLHWLYEFGPSWSCLSFDPKTGEARVRAKRADFATAAQQQRVVNLTVGAVASTRDAAAQQFAAMDTLYKVLEQNLGAIDHTYSDQQLAGPKEDQSILVPGHHRIKPRAPLWSIQQVENLSRFQRSGKMHPFTCPNREDHFDDGIDKGRLVPTRWGWICQCCDYTQDWAHDFMLNWTKEDDERDPFSLPR